MKKIIDNLEEKLGFAWPLAAFWIIIIPLMLGVTLFYTIKEFL